MNMLLIITIALFVIIASFIIPTSMTDVYAELEKIEKKILSLLDENRVYNNNQASSTSSNSNIAFVFPSFTMAAYDNSFYKFYHKYGDIIQKYKDTGEREYITSD